MYSIKIAKQITLITNFKNLNTLTFVKKFSLFFINFIFEGILRNL
jgi:hypothetical protein